MYVDAVGKQTMYGLDIYSRIKDHFRMSIAILCHLVSLDPDLETHACRVLYIPRKIAVRLAIEIRPERKA